MHACQHARMPLQAAGWHGIVLHRSKACKLLRYVYADLHLQIMQANGCQVDYTEEG